VATGAGRLPAKYVFHAVGPIYRGGCHGEAALLASCYRHCLAMADQCGVRTMSFPAIATGVYGYPLDEAAAIAVREVKLHLEQPDTTLQEITFVLFGRRAWEAYAAALNQAPEMRPTNPEMRPIEE
jgi:O-acetyl-ADP-ribose deacetylase (regulator of RNase III)